MRRHPFLGFTLAYNRAFGNIIINTIYVGISMMYNIVLLFPEKRTGPHGICT